MNVYIVTGPGREPPKAIVCDEPLRLSDADYQRLERAGCRVERHMLVDFVRDGSGLAAALDRMLQVEMFPTGG